MKPIKVVAFEGGEHLDDSNVWEIPEWTEQAIKELYFQYTGTPLADFGPELDNGSGNLPFGLHIMGNIASMTYCPADGGQFYVVRQD